MNAPAATLSISHSQQHLAAFSNAGCSYASPCDAYGHVETVTQTYGGRFTYLDDGPLIRNRAAPTAAVCPLGSIDQFIATMAHELRNPLAPIRSGMEILKRDRANGQVSERTRAMMDRQLEHMVQLIDGLLDAARIRTGRIVLNRRRVNLSRQIEIAAEDLRLAAGAVGHVVDVDLPAEEMHVYADGARITQALSSVLENSIKFSPQPGRTVVRARCQAGGAVIEVTDHGIGIPSEMLDCVFLMFFQGEPAPGKLKQGLGIGLYLASTVVQLHGGSLMAKSDGANRGATFRIELPLVPAPSPT